MSRSVLLSSRKVILLNLGFTKCASTFLQSSVLPHLPFSNYLYDGRFYQLDETSSIGVRPVSKNHTSIDSILGDIDIDWEHLLRHVTSNLMRYNIITYSSEILPLQFTKAKQLINFFQKEFPFVHLICFFSVRDVEKRIQSLFSHECLQYYSARNLTYNINDVIFPTWSQAQEAGYSRQGQFELATKRPIVIDENNYAKTIFSLTAHTSAQVVIADKDCINSSRQLWSFLFSAISGRFLNNTQVIDVWLQFINSMNPTNLKTRALDSLDPSLKVLSSDNQLLIDNSNKFEKKALPKVGFYFCE